MPFFFFLLLLLLLTLNASGFVAFEQERVGRVTLEEGEEPVEELQPFAEHHGAVFARGAAASDTRVFWLDPSLLAINDTTLLSRVQACPLISFHISEHRLLFLCKDSLLCYPGDAAADDPPTVILAPGDGVDAGQVFRPGFVVPGPEANQENGCNDVHGVYVVSQGVPKMVSLEQGGHSLLPSPQPTESLPWFEEGVMQDDAFTHSILPLTGMLAVPKAVVFPSSRCDAVSVVENQTMYLLSGSASIECLDYKDEMRCAEQQFRCYWNATTHHCASRPCCGLSAFSPATQPPLLFLFFQVLDMETPLFVPRGLYGTPSPTSYGNHFMLGSGGMRARVLHGGGPKAGGGVFFLDQDYRLHRADRVPVPLSDETGKAASLGVTENTVIVVYDSGTVLVSDGTAGRTFSLALSSSSPHPEPPRPVEAGGRVYFRAGGGVWSVHPSYMGESYLGPPQLLSHPHPDVGVGIASSAAVNGYLCFSNRGTEVWAVVRRDVVRTRFRGSLLHPWLLVGAVSWVVVLGSMVLCHRAARPLASSGENLSQESAKQETPLSPAETETVAELTIKRSLRGAGILKNRVLSPPTLPTPPVIASNPLSPTLVAPLPSFGPLGLLQSKPAGNSPKVK